MSVLRPVSWISNSLAASASLLPRMNVLPPAVKKPLPKEAPQPGKFKGAGGAQAADDKVTADVPAEKEGA